MSDPIDRQAAIDALIKWYGYEPADIGAFENIVEKLPSVQPEQKTCEGCKHCGQWENELEYGVSCPCLVCKRRASDNYERSD